MAGTSVDVVALFKNGSIVFLMVYFSEMVAVLRGNFL